MSRGDESILTKRGVTTLKSLITAACDIASKTNHADHQNLKVKILELGEGLR